MMFCRWSNHLDLIVDGTSAVNSFVIRSTPPWNMFVPLESTSWRTILAQINVALHVALEIRVVDSTGSFNNEIWLERHFHVKETFSVDSDDVSVCENVLDLIVDGASTVSLLVMRSKIPWKMAVPPNGTTLAYKIFAEVNVTLLDVLERSVVDSGNTAGTTLRRNGNVQHRQC